MQILKTGQYKSDSGQLTFSLHDLMDWSEQHEDKIRRDRSEEALAIWINQRR
jgi:hypothetical protein